MVTKLSFSTWYIHCLSIIDWIFFIELFWQYTYQIKSKKLLFFIPTLTIFFLSALCIVSWHYFFNIETFIWLVSFQALLTLIGNTTLLFVTLRKNVRI